MSGQANVIGLFCEVPRRTVRYEFVNAHTRHLERSISTNSSLIRGSGESISSSGREAKHFASKSIGSIEHKINTSMGRKAKTSTTYAMLASESTYDEAILSEILCA